MARKLVDQEEAARILGVSVEEINSLRDKKELFPYRDGDAWKYKPEDLERLKQERAEGAGGSGLGPSWASGTNDPIPLEVNEDVESILLSEKELGESAGTTSSTIIGKTGTQAPSAESDIQLAAPTSAKSDSDVGLAAGASGTGSDVRLVLGGSDVGKKPGSAISDLKLAPSGSSKKGGSSKKDKSAAESDLKLAGDKGDFDDLEIADEDVLSAKPGSDITRGATDSGIHLVDPKDSGLSLEQPLELGGSNVEMLELGEADVISLDESADVEGATQLRSDDDFLLTPVQDAGADESDSGSQVIALDSEEDMSSTSFTPATTGMVAMLEEESPDGGLPGGAPAAGLAAGPALLTAPQVPEAPFSGWSVLGLACCALLLVMVGIVMQDTIRNMWQFESPNPISQKITDSLDKSIGWLEPRR